MKSVSCRVPVNPPSLIAALALVTTAIAIVPNGLGGETSVAAGAGPAKRRAIKQIKSVSPAIQVTARGGLANVTAEGGVTPIDDKGQIELRLDQTQLPGGDLRFVDPVRATRIFLGRAEEGGSYLRLGMSQLTGGNAELPSVSTVGSDWGSVLLNPEGGNVGIGTRAPRYRLEVTGTSHASGLSFDDGVYFASDGANYNLRVVPNTLEINGYNIVLKNHGAASLHLLPDGMARFSKTVEVPVLAITGGADVAEPIEFSSQKDLLPGALVSIDPEHPGMLRASDTEYDPRIAGVISGANGVMPGLTLTTGPKSEAHRHVALTGRVWALASTSNGAIHPGDTLTSSWRPGYAMKATDRSRQVGAAIGKAMTGLDHGDGLVFVLVNLQ